MYSYPVWLFCIPTVMTIDTSATLDENELWIKENCIYIFLNSNVFGR